MTEPLRILCQPWASLPDLPSPRPVLVKDDPEADDLAWEELLIQASEVLYSMTARQFSGGCESTVAVFSRRPYRSGGWVAEAVFGSPVGHGGAASGLPGGGARVGAGRGALVAALPGRPVTAILDATLDGEPLSLEVDLPAGLIWRADRRPWPVCPGDGEALITYSHGQPPPSGGVRSAVLLAHELGKARVGDTTCALPQRVQTLTRQGVTVGFRDSFESLDSNRTGLWTVDAWVQSVNPAKLSAPPAVWSPDAAKTRRKVINP